MNQSLPEPKKQANRERTEIYGRRDGFTSKALRGKAMSCHNNIRNISRISTGSKELDTILYGGIETRAITQFYGDSAQERHNYAIQFVR